MSDMSDDYVWAYMDEDVEDMPLDVAIAASKQYLRAKQKQKMGISKIKSISAEMRKGQQNNYQSHGKTMYTFACELEDGTVGQVSSIKPAPYALPAGTEVEYTFTPNDDTRFLGKLSIKKVEGGGGYGGGHNSPSQAQSASPSDRDISIVTQAILKSVIESGAEPKMWGKLVMHGFTVYDEVVAMRSAPAPVAAPPPAARPTPQAQRPIGQENEQWDGDEPPF